MRRPKVAMPQCKCEKYKEVEERSRFAVNFQFSAETDGDTADEDAHGPTRKIREILPENQNGQSLYSCSQKGEHVCA